MQKLPYAIQYTRKRNTKSPRCLLQSLAFYPVPLIMGEAAPDSVCFFGLSVIWTG